MEYFPGISADDNMDMKEPTRASMFISIFMSTAIGSLLEVLLDVMSIPAMESSGAAVPGTSDGVCEFLLALMSIAIVEDVDILASVATCPAAWQSLLVCRNQQEKSQADAEAELEIRSSERNAARRPVMLRMEESYSAVEHFATDIRNKKDSIDSPPFAKDAKEEAPSQGLQRLEALDAVFVEAEDDASATDDDWTANQVWFIGHHLNGFFSAGWIFLHVFLAVEFVAGIQKVLVVTVADQLFEFLGRKTLFSQVAEMKLEAALFECGARFPARRATRLMQEINLPGALLRSFRRFFLRGWAWGHRDPPLRYISNLLRIDDTAI